MNYHTNKAIVALITTILLVSMSASIYTATAHTPAWTVIDYAYISVAPNPVGVGQTVAVCMWVDYPFNGATVSNDIRRHSYTLTITKPDSTTETKTWDVITDTTGVQSYTYTPTEPGNYTFKFDYPQQTYTWSGAYNGDIFQAASASVVLNVQEDSLPLPLDSYPLPTEYWTRPIEGQNSYWYAISSNWLGAPYTIGAPMGTHGPGGLQLDGVAPDSAHVMWTKPLQYGGVVGGNDTQVLGEMFYQGGSYNVRWSNPLILYGVLYYQEPWGNAGAGGDYVAVDLRTGEELWRINATATGTSLVPSFGYLYSLDQPNQHGVLPNGLLVASTSVANQGTVWRGYDPRSGVLTTMNITNVPGGVNVAGPSGEYLKLILTNNGTASKPTYYLAQWNSSNVFGTNTGTSGTGTWYSGTANASAPSAYDWTVSIPSLTGSSWSIAAANNGLIPFVDEGNMLLLVQGSFGWHADMSATITASQSTDPVNVTAVSLKPGSIGSVLWTKSYAQAPANVTRTLVGWDPSNGVFMTEDKETFKHHGFSLSNGNQLWEATTPESASADWNFFSLDNDAVAYGKLYYFGYSGILYAYDDTNGKLLWTYGNGGEGNSTSSGFGTPYGVYPIFISAIADGKVYLDTTEHSPNSPMWKGAELRCVNATTGAEIWKIYDFGNNMYGGNTPIADGYLTFINTYDCQIYCVGKGPSQMTVSAPNVAAPLGTPIVIRGTVTDIAAGTKQAEQAARFPNGVPAVSDASQSAWMEYVYQQKPKPTDVTGVQVMLSVYDSNGNYRSIGTATTDSSGMFTYTWTPDIEGSYVLTASFAGTNSYYPASAESSFAVYSASPTPVVEQQQINLPPYETYILAMGIAVIAAVAIATLLILRKK
jgi:FOG: WD40-like repeat